MNRENRCIIAPLSSRYAIVQSQFANLLRYGKKGNITSLGACSTYAEHAPNRGNLCYRLRNCLPIRRRRQETACDNNYEEHQHCNRDNDQRSLGGLALRIASRDVAQLVCGVCLNGEYQRDDCEKTTPKDKLDDAENDQRGRALDGLLGLLELLLVLLLLVRLLVLLLRRIATLLLLVEIVFSHLGSLPFRLSNRNHTLSRLLTQQEYHNYI